MRLAFPLILACGSAAMPAAGACRLALAIGLDVSGSISAAEHALQTGGLASALADPDVARAMTAGGVALSVYAWAGRGEAWAIVPWRDVRSTADLAAAAEAVRAFPHANGGRTALGEALLRGWAHLAVRPDCAAHVLDLTGDGYSNDGPLPDRVAPPPDLADATVNALVVALAERQGEEPGIAELSGYFRRWVIRGPGAFVVPSIGFEGFRDAMREKLLRELGVMSLTSLDGQAPG